MATTATHVDETLISDAGSAPGVERAGNAVGAYPTDEEILSIGDAPTDAASARQTTDTSAAPAGPVGARHAVPHSSQTEDAAATSEAAAATAIPEEFQQIFAVSGAGPKLREIHERDAQYREIFPSVNEARAAIEAQRELSRVDELFDSGDPAAHVELMAGLAQRDPQAFRSLAATFGARLAEIDPEAFRVISSDFARAALDAGRVPEQLALLARAAEKGDAGAVKFLAGELAEKLEQMRKAGAGVAGFGAGKSASRPAAMESPWRKAGAASAGATPSAAQASAAAGKFVEDINAEVEKTVEQSVGSRVAELLPDAPDATRRKIAADIYRELDAALKKDAALVQQVSANFTAAHKAGQFGDQQRAAMAALVLGKAQAALPTVAKRVVGEWTTAVMSASHARRAKHGAAAARADVGVGGAPRPITTQSPRIDYRKMSDEEILNAE